MGAISRAAWRLRGAATLAYFAALPAAVPAVVHNLTGLPTYPHLDTAAMDETWRTESLGRWCAKFTGMTSDSLEAVEEWYRKALYQASETDLARDRRYRNFPTFSGIKLALGTSYVAVYRLPNRPTIIELHRCEGSRPPDADR